MGKIDWDVWRKKFVQGPDDLDLKRLSEYKDSPAYQTLRNRSSKEDWPAQRRLYRNNLGTLASTVPEAQQVVQQVTKIIDTAEMLAQHNAIAKALLAKGVEAIRRLNPDEMKPSDITNFIKLGIDTQRLTEGLATQRQEVDLTAMSDAELQKIASGEG